MVSKSNAIRKIDKMQYVVSSASICNSWIPYLVSVNLPDVVRIPEGIE